MSTALEYKDPVRRLNQEFLIGLELVSTKVFPLPGASGRRQSNNIDPRLTKLQGAPIGETVTYYEHIATIHHRASRLHFIAFRETMDAFLARQMDTVKYPEWLIKSPEKQAERAVHIYAVAKHWSQVAVLRSHEDWLTHIHDPAIFDSLAYFLARNSVIDHKAYSTL